MYLNLRGQTKARYRCDHQAKAGLFALSGITKLIPSIQYGTHSSTGSPLSLGGAENDTCSEVDESVTDTASPAGRVDRVTPVPYSSMSGAVIGTRYAGVVVIASPSPMALDANTRKK